MNKKHSVVALVLLLLLPQTLRAENNEWAAWLVGTWRGTIGDAESQNPWGYMVQGQARYYNRLNGLEQFVFRPGVSYTLNDRITMWGGYAYYYTQTRGASLKEDRAWFDLNWTIARWSRSNFKSRSRFESRTYREARDETGFWWRQRFSYEHRPEAWTSTRLIFHSETFFHLRETPWAKKGYTQQRFIAGLRFKPGNTMLEVGYMYQHNRIRGLPDLVNHVAVVSIRN